MGEGRDEIRREHSEDADMALGESQAATSTEESRRMVWIIQTGAWLSVLLSTVNGTGLGAQEFSDSLFVRYGIKPPDLPEYFVGCVAAFYTCHALYCKKGGLITVCHNELRDGVADLSGNTFAHTQVRDNPKIYIGCTVSGGKDNLRGSPSKEVEDLKGVLLVRSWS